MKPSIGRIVHYARLCGPAGKEELRIYPAIIVTVKTTEKYDGPLLPPIAELSANVDLEVFGCKNVTSRGDDGWWFKDVPFSPGPCDGHWSWPPKV